MARDTTWRSSRLDAAGLVYACDCSRRAIAQEVPDLFGIGVALSRAMPVPGTVDPEANPARRVRLADGVERFTDLRLGAQEQAPARQCGDLLVRDRAGQWTYQFAVVVDDMEQGIDVVIRGEDLLASTGRQVRLGRMLGRASSPQFFHHALLLRPDGSKLSKSAGDTGLRELRAAGMSAARVLGEAAYQGGLLPDRRALSVDELAEVVLRR